VDGRVEAASLNGFIASYQSVETLKLGELWALPLMLRLALIEICGASRSGLLPRATTAIWPAIGRRAWFASSSRSPRT